MIMTLLQLAHDPLQSATPQVHLLRSYCPPELHLTYTKGFEVAL